MRKIFIAQFIKKYILNLSINQRRTILLIFDSSLILFSVFITKILMANNLNNLDISPIFQDTLILIVVGLPLYLFTGQYKGLSRYVGSQSLYRLALRNLIIITIFFLYQSLEGSIFNSLKASIICWLSLTSISGFLRFGLRDLLLKMTIFPGNDLRNVVIYGTGAESVQLFASLRLSQKYNIAYFVDDNPLVLERFLYDVKIISSTELGKIASTIDQVLLGSPFESLQKRKKFLKLLENYNLPVMQFPSIDQLTSRGMLKNNLEPINIEDLLGRESDQSLYNLSNNIIKNKVVFVTGAGGSIGSELCKKIVSLGPKLIILLENNEANLYKITNEILKNDKVSVKTFLGSVGNKLLLEKIFYRYKVDIVFHAAAYKHVPIVQDNPIEGIRNNVLNTKLLCEVVFEFKIKNIILISTDKAVRPTNIMGATKRVAELIFQSFSEESFLYSQENPNNNYSKFSMVRFGNVLGSSGSVVPLFQSQIDEGGPITLTDPNVVRYFMTIPEAAQLVIQAAAMSEGGELFLLDMGNPIKIKYLAEQMIRLNGLKLKSNKYPDGDIAIQISGLRPGEKLYEELLIDGASEETLHPGIFKSRESFLKKDILWKKLNQLSSLIDKLNEKESLEIIAELVPEWEYERNKIN